LNKKEKINLKKEKTEKEKINETVNESLKTLLSEYLCLEDRTQVIIAWELQRIADALEKIANCEHKGVFLVERPV